MKSVYRYSLALAVLLLLLAPVAVLAQTTGTIEGQVTDQSGAALPGVTVDLAGAKLQGAKSGVTSADGRYRFINLVPGEYTVTATLAGFGKVQKKATVTLDATATANMQLTLSTTAEVTVTGEAPLIDSTSTTAGENVSGKVINVLPLASRNYADVVFTQPGVQADNGETQGRSLAISVYGSTSAENSFIIDGVNTTNVIKGIQGKDINNEFIQEVEVKTGGYQAEYGRNTGGVVNVITKSGGNEFHGGIFGYYNNLSLASSQKQDTTQDFNGSMVGQCSSASGNCTPTPGSAGNAQLTTIETKNTRSEGGLDLGGFMVKDRVWFFAAYDRVITGQNFNPTTGVGSPNQPSYPSANCTTAAGCPFPDTITENKYSLKLTLNLAQSTTLQGVYFSDRQSTVGTIATNPQSFNPFATQGRIDVGGPDYGARLNQLFGSSGILTLAYGQHSDRFQKQPQGRGVNQTIDLTSSVNQGYPDYYGGYGQIFGPIYNNFSTRQAYAGNYTGYVGNHEFKVGGDYEKVNTQGSTYWTGSFRNEIRPCLQGSQNTCDLTQAPFYTNGEGFTYQVYYQHDMFTANASDLTPLVTAPFGTPTKRYSGFVQDQWRIIPSLTANFGLRYDTETLYNGCADAPNAAQCAGLSSTAFSLSNEWAPRIGVTWDFVGDGTSKLYASAGRFYYAIPTDLNVRVFTANTSLRTFSYDINDLSQAGGPCPTGAPTAGCVPRAQRIQVGAIVGEPVDPGIKASYQDELTLGVEKAIDPTLSVGVKATYRSLGRTIEDRCDLNYATNPTGSSCALTNPGSTGIDNPGAAGLYGSCNGSANPVTNPSGYSCTGPGQGNALPPAKRIFKGIELVVRKQFTNEIWAQLSYLGSSLRGNYSGAIKESSGQTDPGINADFDYFDLTRNASGILELDRPNQGRLDAVYNAPWGLSAGVQFYMRTGVPTSIQGYYNGFYPQELYLDQRGYAGRLPLDYELNMSLGYNLNVGPVTITPQVYAFQLLNRQTTTSIDERFNPNASFVTDPASPFYGQAGVEPGTTGPLGNVCPATAVAPCTDNPNYRKTTVQGNPRQIRFALKVTF
jgi:outer membrane receptor protein involved in Fe transport